MEEKKKQLGELEESLVNEIDSYVKLVNEHKSKNEKNISRIDLIRNHFKDLLADKVLTNDFITLERPFYFNKYNLITKGTAEATVEKPSSKLKDQYIIYKVPNNLDNWINEFNSYCTEKNVHEGILPYIDVVIDNEGAERNVIDYFIFKLRTERTSSNVVGRITTETYITVNYIPSEDLELFLNQYEEDLAEELLATFSSLEEAIVKDRTEEGLTARVVYKKYNDFEVLRNLSLDQYLNNTGRLFSNILNTAFNNILEAKNNFEVISKELNEKKEQDNITLSDVEKWENIMVEDELKIVNSFFQPDLSSKDSKTFDKVSEILDELPDNPLANFRDSTLEYLEEVNESEEEVPKKEVQDTLLNMLFETGVSIKEHPLYNKQEVLNLLKENGLNPVLLDYLELCLDSDSIEEYDEGINKLSDNE